MYSNMGPKTTPSLRGGYQIPPPPSGVGRNWQPLWNRVNRKWGQGLEIGQTLGYWPPNQLSLKKFLIWSFLLREHQKSKRAARVPLKWPMGSENVFILRFLGATINFWKISFLIRALFLWEKVATVKMKKNVMENNDVYSSSSEVVNWKLFEWSISREVVEVKLKVVRLCGFFQFNEVFKQAGAKLG